MRIFLSLGLMVGSGLMLIPTVPAQQEKPLDSSYLRQHALTRGFMLGRPVKPLPTPDGKSVLFLRSSVQSPRLSLYEYDVASKQTRELLSPEKVLQGAEEKLSPEEKAQRERMRVSAGGIASYQLAPDGKSILLSLSGKLYLYQRGSGAIAELKTGGKSVLDPKFAPDGKRIAYVRAHDVYVYDLTAQAEQRVTTGGTKEFSNGLAEFIAQEEMGRFTGYWWAPDSKSIVFQQTDARGVEVWYVADPTHPEQAPQPSYYPRPGKANVKVTLGVSALGGAEPRWVVWDEGRYPYLVNVKWPKAGPLLVTVQSRDQRELVVLKAEPTTGATTELLRETDKSWVNIYQEAPYWLPDNLGFLWISEADGGPQLEWREPDGKLKQVLVGKEQGLRGLCAYDPHKQRVLYTASTDPAQLHVYATMLALRPATEQLSKEPGLHSVAVARGQAFYVLSSRPRDGMPRTTLHAFSGEQLGELPSLAQDPPFQPRVEYLRVGDSPSFVTAVSKPTNFDAKKRYPVIVDVYGGPHHIHVLAAQNRWLLNQWLADQGFIVVAIDGRGTPGRGRDWERAIFKKFGSVPLDDQAVALRALGKRIPQMDLERVGISGWSFGGYMAGLAVLRQPGLFKAGVAGAPVVDWLDYDTHYTERYLGIPPADDAAYKDASLLTYAKDLQRPLLLLHGTADDNVYFRHSLKLTNALFRAGKDFEILPLSSLTHMVPDPVVMENLHLRIARFFQKHLGAPRS